MLPMPLTKSDFFHWLINLPLKPPKKCQSRSRLNVTLMSFILLILVLVCLKLNWKRILVQSPNLVLPISLKICPLLVTKTQQVISLVNSVLVSIPLSWSLTKSLSPQSQTVMTNMSGSQTLSNSLLLKIQEEIPFKEVPPSHFTSRKKPVIIFNTNLSR